jgi:hypothetical protein
VPPPALTVDPGTAAKKGLKELLAGGWCEYEFDTQARNGTPRQPPEPEASGDPAELVN